MTHWIATHPWTAIAATCALAAIVGGTGCYVAFLVGRLTSHWQLWSLALLLLAAPAVGSDVRELTRSEHVRTIETNHVHCDQTGRETFTQNLFVDYLPHLERAEIIAWRMEPKSCRPERDWQRGGWTMLWLDGDAVRRVTADSWHESWETFDVEIQRRPEERRRELLSPPRPPLP